MAQYSIKELEDLSGVKAHTLRIWEKRYGIVSPRRTATNIRLYSDDDLKKVIAISMLNGLGEKISRIATLSPSELSSRLKELSERESEPQVHIDRLVMAMIDLDEERFEAILKELIQRFGFEQTYLDIAYPFLQKIGLLWLTRNITPIQEHFISNLLRQKLLVAIDSLPLASRKAPKAILFLPEGELHELGLLFAHYIVKKSGFRAYYMGQSVPFEDIQWFCRNQSPAALITIITTSPPPNLVEGYLRKLCSEKPGAKVFVAGPRVTKMALQMPKNLHFIQHAGQLKALLKGPQSK